jgi:phage gpG-like protein
MGETMDSVNNLKAALEAKGRAVETNLTQAITNACLRIETTSKKMMQQTQLNPEGAVSPRTGRKLGRWKKGQLIHMSSADGQAPAIDMGQLVRSVTHDVDGDVGYVGTKVIYGKFLEFGTSRMAARPWLRPSIDANRSKFQADLNAVLSQPSVPEDGGAE